MKLRKLSAIMMAAIVATSTPAGAVLGQITAYADSDKDKSKDYEIGGADWDVQEDANGKIHIYATWDASDDSCRATITVTRDDKKTGISVDTTTKAGSVELTQQIKKYGKTGDYTFKIKAKSKSKDEDGKSTGELSESESDFLEIDSDMMKKLSSTAATNSGVNTNNTPGSSIPTPGTAGTPGTPGTPSAGPSGTSTPATQSTSTSGDFLTNGVITDWGIGHVYLVNGAPVFSKWIVDSGKLYHIGANGFMDKNLIFSDYTGTHYVGADGALVY